MEIQFMVQWSCSEKYIDVLKKGKCMPLFAKGCYAKCNEDYPYEVETNICQKIYYGVQKLSGIICNHTRMYE